MSNKDFPLRGVSDVSAERLRQITQEGYSAERDDSYEGGELAAAGACYAFHASIVANEVEGGGDIFTTNMELSSAPIWWPWGQDAWKPGSIRSNLVKAAALIIAEIDRLDRQEESLGKKNSDSQPQQAPS